MMKLACKDINPSTTCNFSVTGNTASESAAKMVAHAKAEHADEVASMSDADMMAAFESKVHE